MTFVVRPFASKYPLTPLPIRSNNYLLTFRRDGRQFVIKIYQPKPLTLKIMPFPTEAWAIRVLAGRRWSWGTR